MNALIKRNITIANGYKYIAVALVAFLSGIFGMPGKLLATGVTSNTFSFDVTIDGVDAIFIGGRTDVLPIPTPDGNPDAFILKRHSALVPEFPLTEELPPSVPIAEGAVVRVVSRAIGGVSFFNGFNGPIFGPDGNGASGSDLSSLGGISGYKGPQGALAGVFLDDSIPSVGPAPATLDFTPTGLGRNFGALSPALAQVFFIGDGFRSNGQRHRFIAPSGATRLVLGIPDGGAFVGAPGFYEDNNGGYTVGIGATIVGVVASSRNSSVQALSSSCYPCGVGGGTAYCHSSGQYYRKYPCSSSDNHPLPHTGTCPSPSNC